jgi:hypothetical protein
MHMSKITKSDFRVGFEAEIMFPESGYPQLIEAAAAHGFVFEGDVEAPAFMRRIIAADLGRAVGAKVTVPTRKNARPGRQWAVKADYDAEHAAYSQVACAVALVTPPLGLKAAEKALDALLAFIAEHQGVGTDNTSLHMSIDAPEDLVEARLALEVPEERLLKTFGRLRHRLLIPQRHAIVVETAAALIGGNRHALDIDFFNARLGRGQQFGIDFGKLAHFGFIEFRHCGGRGYPCQVDEIMNTLDTYLAAMERSEQSWEVRDRAVALVRDEVEEVAAVARSIRLERDTACKGDGLEDYKAMLDDQVISSITQESASQFSLGALGREYPTTALRVGSLASAQALTAFDFLRRLNR